MEIISVKQNGGLVVSAEILPDVAAVGEEYKGKRVTEVAPYFLEEPQVNPDIYNYAIWCVRVSENPPYLIAVHEPESDTM